MSTSSMVSAGCFAGVVWVRVQGKGSFQNSAGLKDFVKKMILKGHREFVIDLIGCEHMDSTFMGTLAGVALRLRELGQGTLQAINVNERNAELLENLGLDQLFNIYGLNNPAAPSEPDLDKMEGLAKADPAAQKETVLEAHEALVEATPENAAKFRDVLEYLKQDMAQDEES